MKSLNVLIIGAGQIGAFFDTPDNKFVLSHAHAFKKHSGFNLIGFFDTNIKKAEKAAKIWEVQAFSSLGEAFAQNDIEVVVVAVSDDFHYSVLCELSNYPIKLIFTEKPLTKTIKESQEIIKIFKKKKTAIVVNFSRRFIPEFLVLKSEIASGEFGKFLSGSGYYGKGTLHNGSHMIDLIIFLFGSIIKIQGVSQLFDYFEDDPSCSTILTFKLGGKFHMQAIDCRNYSIFEFDLFFEHKRVKILESGLKIEYYDVSESKIYSGYRELNKSKCINTTLRNSLNYASENIFNFLKFGSICPSMICESILSQKVCSSIIKKTAK